MKTLPILYIERLLPGPPEQPTDGLPTDTLRALADALQAKGFRAPPFSALARGAMIASGEAPHALFCLGQPSPDQLDAWFSLARAGLSSLACVCAEDLDQPGALTTADIALLSGHGVALASRGTTGQPLVNLPVQQLRRALEQNPHRLARATGYPPRILAPPPDPLGRALDGLLLQEARRAGFRRVLTPSDGLLRFDADPIAGSLHGCAPLPYRPVRSDDTPDALLDWLVNRRLARPLARFKDAARAPRRILDRLTRS